MQTPEIHPLHPESSSAPSSKLPSLGFLLLGALSLASAALWLAIRPEMLYDAAPGTPAFAWLVLVIGGFLFSTVFAGVYAQGPGVFRKRLFWRVQPAAHLLVHLLCTLLVVPFALGSLDDFLGRFWMVPYALAVVFIVPLIFAVQGGPAREPGTAFLRAGAFWMVLVFAAVPVLVSHHAKPFLREGQWIFAALLLLLVGVLLNLLLGGALLLVRTESQHSPASGTPALSWVLVNLGVAFGFFAVALGPRELVAGSAVVLGGGLLVGCLELVRSLRRSEPSVTSGLRFLLALLLMGVLALAIGVSGQWQAEATAGVVQTSFVLTLVLGVLGLSGIGFCDLLLPGLTGSRTGGEPHPLLLQIRLAGYINGLVGIWLMAPGMWIASEKVVSLGAYFFLAGVAAFVLHLVLAATLFRTVSRPLAVAGH